MADTKAVFHADHANLANPGAAISDSTVAAARLALRSMKGMDGVTPINATPKFLLVPAALENTAEKYSSTIYPAEAANVNEFGGTNKLTLVVDPRLDSAISATAWYVFADPAVLPVIEYAYLAGFEGVNIETRNGFDVDGVEIRARLDFGAGVIDYRAGYKGNAYSWRSRLNNCRNSATRSWRKWGVRSTCNSVTEALPIVLKRTWKPR